jgi:formylglycine-generating enzyme required for sulfatase activity
MAKKNSKKTSVHSAAQSVKSKAKSDISTALAAAADQESTPNQLCKLAAQSPALARVVAANPAINASVVKLLKKQKDPKVNRALAANPGTPMSDLLELGERYTSEFVQNPIFDLALAADPRFIGNFPENLVKNIITNQQTPDNIFLWCVRNEGQFEFAKKEMVYKWVANAILTRIELSEALVAQVLIYLDSDLLMIAQSMRLSQVLVRHLSAHKDKNVRLSIAMRDDLPADVIARLSSDRAKQVRKVFAPTDLSWCKILRQDPDPTVVTNPELLNAISNTGLPWRVRDIGTGIEMLLIPPGIFQMGDLQENPHQVKLTKAFYLGRYQVTQAQWQGKMRNNPSEFKDKDSASRPVESVSWNDIAGFNTATGLRLPTEAEWEYACRAGTTTHFHSMPDYPNGTNDDSLLGNIAWYRSNNSPSGTKPVGGKAANAFGMYDMSGNVLEWCNDWYCDYIYIDFGRIQPTGPTTGDFRVLRGGHWLATSIDCRSSDRGGSGPDDRMATGLGFRVARTP